MEENVSGCFFSEHSVHRLDVPQQVFRAVRHSVRVSVRLEMLRGGIHSDVGVEYISCSLSSAERRL